MSETKLIPTFKSDEEEVEFWDSLDTAQILEEGEEIELEYKPEPAAEDICIHCGERMIERKRDIDVPGEEITIHIKEYYCPKCKKSRIGAAESKRLSEVLVGLLSARSEGVLERSIMGANMNFFYPIHIMPPYKNEEKFPVADGIAKRGVNLPSGSTLK